MSGIYIPGMEMPKSCWCCPLCNEDVCEANEMTISRDHSKDRSKGCPLVPVPDHGRLIDADALDDVLLKLADNEYSPKVFASWLTYEENAPTIIEADKGVGE